MILQAQWAQKPRASTLTQLAIKKKMSESCVHPDFTRTVVCSRMCQAHTAVLPVLLGCCGRNRSRTLRPFAGDPALILGTNWYQFPASQANSNVSLGRETRGHSANQQGDGSSTPELLSEPCQHHCSLGPCPIPSSAQENSMDLAVLNQQEIS